MLRQSLGFDCEALESSSQEPRGSEAKNWDCVEEGCTREEDLAETCHGGFYEVDEVVVLRRHVVVICDRHNDGSRESGKQSNECEMGKG